MCEPGPVDTNDADSNPCGCTVQVSFPQDQDQDGGGGGSVCVPYNLCKSGIPHILTTGQECDEYKFSDIKPCTGTAPPTPQSTPQPLPYFPHYGPVGPGPTQPQPQPQPAAATNAPAPATKASDTDPWEKKHWWAILLAVVGALSLGYLCYWSRKKHGG